jgi:hypothetical protein
MAVSMPRRAHPDRPLEGWRLAPQRDAPRQRSSLEWMVRVRCVANRGSHRWPVVITACRGGRIAATMRVCTWVAACCAPGWSGRCTGRRRRGARLGGCPQQRDCVGRAQGSALFEQPEVGGGEQPASERPAPAGGRRDRQPSGVTKRHLDECARVPPGLVGGASTRPGEEPSERTGTPASRAQLGEQVVGRGPAFRSVGHCGSGRPAGHEASRALEGGADRDGRSAVSSTYPMSPSSTACRARRV